MAKVDCTNKKFRFRDDMCDQIKEIAQEEGISETQVMENAFKLYYAHEVMPEHVIEARINQLQHQINLMDKKLETFAGLYRQCMPYILGALPPLPKNEVNAQGVKYNPGLEKGNDVFIKLINGYRNQMKINNISFVQAVWGDSLEDIRLTGIDQGGSESE